MGISAGNLVDLENYYHVFIIINVANLLIGLLLMIIRLLVEAHVD